MSLIGETLGQFQIVDELGKGGMATVYKAYQPILQRYVAIKVLSPALAEDMDLVKRFLREARSAAALHHPNIIVIHDVGSQGDIHYIVSEHLEGMTLSKLLEQEGALSPERTLGILRQVGSALDYAHSRGLIHRDIKPSNIMVDPARNDRVTLMDFGLVQVAGASKITRTGFIMGTPDYMSPEQAQGEAIDYRTDIYSLGVTAYHMLTGKVPFVKATPHAILLAHIMEEPPPMAVPDYEFAPELQAIVTRAMAKNPANRYEWAGDMAKDLELAITNPTALSLSTGGYSGAQVSTVTTPTPQTPSAGVPVYRQTPPAGVSRQPAPPPGAPAYRLTPPTGVAAYPTAPVPSVAPQVPRRRWIWPVLIGAGGIGLLSVMIIVGFLVAPSLLAQLPAVRQATQAAQTATAAALTTPTAWPITVERFEVSPREIVEGASVRIEWQVSGLEFVSIRPDVAERAPARGDIQHRPSETTVYELVLPDGRKEQREVKVNPAPLAPTIEYLSAEPENPVRGTEFELSWRVTGQTTKVELSVNLGTVRTVSAESTLALTADQTATYILTAFNGELSSSRTVVVKVAEPTSSPTQEPTPIPTQTKAPTPKPTSTPVPPTVTPTLVPQTPTKPPTAAPATPRPTAASTTAPSSGVLFSFEQWSAWKRGDQPYGQLNQTQEQAKSGSSSAKLSYEFPAAGDDFVVFTHVMGVGGKPNTISAWVYGDGSSHFLNVWIQDAQNQIWSVHLGRVGMAGWQQLSGTIDPNRPWPSGTVSGPDNGVIDYPIRFYGIVLDRPAAGPLNGAIYIDDITVSQAAINTSVPGAMATQQPVAPGAGEIGRIVFTVQVGEAYVLYSTDPSWNKMVKIGDTDGGHSTCIDGSVATTLDGITVNLRGLDRCAIAGTVGSCISPNGQYKVNTNRKGDGYSVTLWRVGDDKMLEAYYEGPLSILPGLNWAPDSSHFLFTVEQSVYRADVGTAGYYLVIPFKDNQWPLQYTPDGGSVFYLKPVSGAIADIFVANPDGSNERNLTNSPIAVKLCPRWRN